MRRGTGPGYDAKPYEIKKPGQDSAVSRRTRAIRYTTGAPEELLQRDDTELVHPDGEKLADVA
jgi:hypothetical protein